MTEFTFRELPPLVFINWKGEIIPLNEDSEEYLKHHNFSELFRGLKEEVEKEE
jgi:hypothetical protein